MQIFFGGRSKEEVEAKFDELLDAASDHICGPDAGPDHECAFDWTAGGSILSDEQSDKRYRKEDAADAMYDSLLAVVAVCKEKMAPWDTTLQQIQEEAERGLRIADAGYEIRKSEAQRRRH